MQAVSLSKFSLAARLLGGGSLIEEGAEAYLKQNEGEARFFWVGFRPSDRPRIWHGQRLRVSRIGGQLGGKGTRMQPCRTNSRDEPDGCTVRSSWCPSGCAASPKWGIGGPGSRPSRSGEVSPSALGGIHSGSLHPIRGIQCAGSEFHRGGDDRDNRTSRVNLG